MKRYLKTLILLVVTAGLFSWYYFYEVKGASKRREKETEKKKIFPFTREEITLLEFSGSETTITCIREGKTWKMTSPRQLEADGEEIGKILDGLLGLEESRSLGVVNDLSEFGFLPEKTVTLGTEKEKKTIRFGGENPTGDSWYILKNQNEVILVSRGSREDILSRSVDSLREKRILALDTSDIVSLQVTRARCPVSFVKKESTWFLEKPVHDEADRWAVEDFLREISTSKVKEFMEDTRTRGNYGFQEPVLVVKAKASGGGLFTLTVGKKKDPSTRYAQSSTHAEIFTVEETLLTKLSETLDDLRQKSIFTLDSYNVKEIRLKKGSEELLLTKIKSGDRELWQAGSLRKSQLKQEKVTDYLYDLTGLKIQKFFDASSEWLVAHHLKTPEIIVKLTDKDGKSQEVFFGEKAEESWYGYLPGRQVGFSVSAGDYEKVNKTIKDFLPEPEKKTEEKKQKNAGIFRNLFRKKR